MRQRRIGTITLGISLVVFGILFLIHIFGGVLNYMLIFHLLYYSFFAPEKSGTYDFAAVVILIMIVFFAMCMAGADMVFSHMPENVFDKLW